MTDINVIVKSLLNISLALTCFYTLICILQSFGHPIYGCLYVVNDEQVPVYKTCLNVMYYI